MVKLKQIFFSIIILGTLAFTKDYFLQIPEGFPQPYIPEYNQLTAARVELGKKLFFDTVLSRDSSISCASCHKPEFAFTDREQKGIGIKGQVVSRNTPTLTNVGYNKILLLDGVNPGLESQATVPFQETKEFDLHILLAGDRLAANPEYVALSQKAYGQDPNPFVLTSAIAAFQRTLISGNSRFDQYHYQDRKDALNGSEKRGMDLFFNQLHCAECHSGFNFTEQGLTNNGLYETYQDTGRMRLTHLESDRAIFKVPTLRNIGVTYPYMHDGSLETLEDVVEHYMSGGKDNPNKSEHIKPFHLSKTEKTDLIAFLHSLTDSSFIAH